MPKYKKTISTSKSYDPFSKGDKSARFNHYIFFLLQLMLVFSTLAFGAVDSWALGLLSICSGLILVFWIADTLENKQLRINNNLILLPVLVFAAIALIQLLPLRGSDLPEAAMALEPVRSLSIDPYQTRFFIIQLFAQLVFFAAALTFINTQSRLRKMVVTIIIFGTVMSFFGTLQQMASTEAIFGLRPTQNSIPFATFINKHHFAAFMEMTIGIAAALLFGSGTKKDKRLLLIVAIVIMGIGLIFTGSRGGMISLFAVLGFITLAALLQHRADKKAQSYPDESAPATRNLAIIGGGVALIVVLFGSVLLLGGNDPLLRGVGLQNPEEISSGRLHFWQVAWQVIKDYPILGAGFNSFGTAFSHYDTWNGNLRIENAHNEYLQVLAESGIIGFACVAGFIYLLFKQGLQVVLTATDRFRRSVATGALAGCFGILMHSFFDFPLRTPSNALFFLALCALSVVPIFYPKFQPQK